MKLIAVLLGLIAVACAVSYADAVCSITERAECLVQYQVCLGINENRCGCLERATNCLTRSSCSFFDDDGNSFFEDQCDEDDEGSCGGLCSRIGAGEFERFDDEEGDGDCEDEDEEEYLEECKDRYEDCLDDAGVDEEGLDVYRRRSSHGCRCSSEYSSCISARNPHCTLREGTAHYFRQRELERDCVRFNCHNESFCPLIVDTDCDDIAQRECQVKFQYCLLSGRPGFADYTCDCYAWWASCLLEHAAGNCHHTVAAIENRCLENRCGINLCRQIRDVQDDDDDGFLDNDFDEDSASTLAFGYTIFVAFALVALF